MNRQAAFVERLLIQLAAHIDNHSASVRLLYDDHHAGNRLALVARSPAGLFELQIWREADSKLRPRIHLLCDSAAAADGFAAWIDNWAQGLGWPSLATKKFAKRIGGLAKELSSSFTTRATGYPNAVRAQLETATGSARPLAGITGPLSGNQEEALAVVAGGLHSTLWGAAVVVGQLDNGAVLERALVWDPRAQAFIAPRELRALLTHRHPLPELAHAWPAWGLAPPAPHVIEQALPGLDYRSQAEGQNNNPVYGDDCIVCYTPCEGSGFDCGLFELGDCSLFECGGLDCIPCDF